MLIGAIAKGKDEIRVSLAEFQGSRFIDVRVYYHHKDSDEWRPTKKGIAVSPGKLAELRELLDTAEEEMKSEGWI